VPRNLAHLVVTQRANAEPYRPHDRRIEVEAPPSPPNPNAHAASLRKALEVAALAGEARRAAAAVSVEGATPGLYVEFDSLPGFALKLESLSNKPSGIELVTVMRTSGGVERATAFVPEGKLNVFLKRVDQYANERTANGERKNKAFVESVAEIRLATLRALWTDVAAAFPKKTESIWWEVWLRATDGNEERRLRKYAEAAGLSVGPRRLTFPDRVVLLVQGTAEALSASLDVLSDIAELRRAAEAGFEFFKMDGLEQADWVDDLRSRLRVAGVDAPAVCVLDTGVNREHPLLSDSLGATDLHAVDPVWKASDHHGHGTEMAGLALLGDLTPPLVKGVTVQLLHALESVKVLPPSGQNPPELYGAVIAEAVSRVEISAPQRRRSFSMAVTAKHLRDRGQPTSWSAGLDAIAAGRSFDSTTKGLEYFDDEGELPRRLFVLSAGNVDAMDIDHLARSDTECIHDPAQAWNALTVGAFTDRCSLDPTDHSLRGWSPVAKPGDLSPYSTTSLTFQQQWPIKPDVVFEGGNKIHDGTNAYQHDVLSLVTTYYKHHERLLVPTWATSAATAQVARFAGVLSAEYPSLWPETLRALVVHSAEWTPRMLEYARGANKAQLGPRLLRRFGFGVPDLERARRSASNALTLIVQDELRPFEDGKYRDFKVHELPWPVDELEQLGEAIVRMRVTLSYFVEPNPARRGWRSRYRYASHGLRFDVASPTESVGEFKKRLNKMALGEEERRPDRSEVGKWTLGPQVRHRGSLHADIWEGAAVDLARRGRIGVLPVAGWWKDDPKRDRSEFGGRYALVVSIEAPSVETDLYTPVATKIGVPVTVAT